MKIQYFKNTPNIKMPVDNFPIIEQYLAENIKETGDFFRIQVLCRKKDGHIINKNTRRYKHGHTIIYTKNLYSTQDLIDIKSEIQLMCNEQRARCYISINKRNDADVSNTLLQYIVELHINKNFKKMQYAYEHCVGVSMAERENKRYLVDIDDDYVNSLDEITKYIYDIQNIGRGKVGKIITLPTKNGFHLLAPAFDVNTFKKIYPEIGVQTNSITLLYCF